MQILSSAFSFAQSDEMVLVQSQGKHILWSLTNTVLHR